MREVGSMGVLLCIIMDYGCQCELWLADSGDFRGRTPLHVLIDSPACAACVYESDCEPLGWHQWHDWHIEKQLDRLDSGLLPAAVVLLAFCASGGLLVIKTLQLPPSA